ncbi:MAG TPA: glycosyltransferase family 2 protein, partial [Paracoccaceae bacterium]|nr:glycosyltransferase family 2 protein [Paracoccaceae bacterium]
MRIYVHIGLEQVGAARLQNVLAAKRDQMIGKGVLFARSPGNKNHTRLFMAVTDPDHIDPLRYNRGYITAEKQAVLRDALTADLAREVVQHSPETLILSCSQLGASLARTSELERLRAMLLPLSNDIRIVAHVDEQGRLLARHYADQVMEGRATSLELEAEMAGTPDWWDDCLLDAHKIDPQAGQFLETQTPAFWLDYPRLVTHWEGVFGPGTVSLRPYDEALIYGEEATQELRAAFGISDAIGKAEPAHAPVQPSEAWLSRARQLNALLLRVLAGRKRILPRILWRRLINEIKIEGDALDPACLGEIAKTFEAANATLLTDHPALTADLFKRDRAKTPWSSEADPGNGYRASQYLLAFMYRIDKATQDERKAKATDLARLKQGTALADDAGHDAQESSLKVNGLSPVAERILPPLAKQNYEKLLTSSFKP